MIRKADAADFDRIWPILRDVFRAGDTYAVDPDISKDDALAYWTGGAGCYVAEDATGIVGTYYIKTNYQGGAAHICNCGYVTAHRAQGRGVARALCEHSQDVARDLGYRAMQFNLVLASNVRAVALWERLGFAVAGTLPDAFDHPNLGMVDAHVMWKAL